MAALKTIVGNWYDYPQYYDVAFRTDTVQQADFLEAVARKHHLDPFRTILEPACGSGRLVAELASRGYELTGFDLSAKMLAYVRRRLRRRHLQAHIFAGDMTHFTLPTPVDLAYNYCNTFRHLLTEEDARNHLHAVAANLRPGGLYLLGLHIFPPGADTESEESWVDTYRDIKVKITLQTLKTRHEERLEDLRFLMMVQSPRKKFRVSSDTTLRTYTVGQFRALLDAVPELELCDVYDFWYQVDQPRQLDETSADTVVVLRKRPLA